MELNTKEISVSTRRIQFAFAFAIVASDANTSKGQQGEIRGGFFSLLFDKTIF